MSIFEKYASYDGFMFETFGEELDFVLIECGHENGEDLILYSNGMWLSHISLTRKRR